MSKIVIEDIKKDRRSLRDVLPARGESHSSLARKHKHPETEEIPTRTTRRHYQTPTETSSTSFAWLWGAMVIIGVVVFLGYFVAPMFTRVTVEVFAKQLTADVSEPLTASRDSISDKLTFTVLPSVEKDFSMSVPATGSKNVETKASGKIKIINNFSTASQALVASTRFTAKDGKIYRIAQSVTVPGMKGANPGSIDVVVYADKPGPDYNGALTDFTIPGFAGSPKFEKITARSVTPFTGGMVGNIKVVASSTETDVKNKIAEKLKADLRAAVLAQMPDGFFTNDGLIRFNYDISQTPQSQATSTAMFVGKGTAIAIIFNENNFTSYLVEAAINPESAKRPIKIENLADLKIALTPVGQSADWDKAESLDLAVAGKAHFVWQIDPKKLANELAGKPKEAFASVFDGYGETIDHGGVIFHPSWSNHFPADPSLIEIKLLTAKPE